MDRMLIGTGLLVLLIQRSCSGYYWGKPYSESSSLQNTPPRMEKPEFEETETDILAHLGSTAFLPCRVRNLGDKMVSWIRTKDLHILTAGVHTFTSDVRFSSAGVGRSIYSSPNWGLQLRNVQSSDAGIYECQVSVEPKISRKVTLEVDENLGDSPHSLSSPALDEVVRDISQPGPATKILGHAEQFVQIGSTVTLTCLVLPADNKLATVDWLKDGRQVTFQATRGGISVVTDRSDKKTTSSLTIADVTEQDSGNYTCRPRRGPVHSIQLLVLEGEKTGAMKRSGNWAARTTPLTSLIVTQVLLYASLFDFYTSRH